MLPSFAFILLSPSYVSITASYWLRSGSEPGTMHELGKHCHLAHTDTVSVSSPLLQPVCPVAHPPLIGLRVCFLRSGVWERALGPRGWVSEGKWNSENRSGRLRKQASSSSTLPLGFTMFACISLQELLSCLFPMNQRRQPKYGAPVMCREQCRVV